ncbi:MAG: hypothetical protein JWS08_19965 [Phormidium sp. PBR-2020]|nr:MAG: hypothetical protein JWS08_19965 [Phormidium sp. PBR-2020]
MDNFFRISTSKYPAPMDQINLEKKVNIVALANNNYAKYLCVTLLSILENSKVQDRVKFCFSILDREITEKSKFLIESCLKSRSHKNFEFDWIPLSSSYIEKRFGFLLKNLKTVQNFPVYLTFDACNLVRSTSDKIICIDSDTLVLGDILELWDIPMDDYPTLAAIDLGFPRFKYRQWPMHKFPKAFKQCHPQTPYFNSGVVVIDVQKWKKLDIPEIALIEAITAVKEDPSSLEYSEQDPLNLAWKGNVKQMHLEWNAQSSLFFKPNSRMQMENIDVETAIQSPKIVHYTMPYCKPWRPNCTHPLAHLYQPYLSYVERHFSQYERINFF